MKQESFAKSPAKYRAYKDGVPLSDFVAHRDDNVFGGMYYENSLKGAIGLDNAKGYYAKGEK